MRAETASTVAKTGAPEGVLAAQARALGLPGDDLGEPAGAHGAGYEDDQGDQRPAGEVDDLVHGALQGGEAEGAQRARQAGQDYAPEEDRAEQARGPPS
jgi:hypothetical protein